MTTRDPKRQAQMERLLAERKAQEAWLASLTPADRAKWEADHASLWGRMQSETCPPVPAK